MPSSNLPITQIMFFWDQNMLQRGKSNFVSKWGNRKLEDNGGDPVKNQVL